VQGVCRSAVILAKHDVITVFNVPKKCIKNIYYTTLNAKHAKIDYTTIYQHINSFLQVGQNVLNNN